MMNEVKGCPPERAVRSWIRRPDAAFWRELFSPTPAATDSDRERRARITRYAAGAALLSTVPYIVLELLFARHDLDRVTQLNAAALAGYGCAMWAGALGAQRAARLWLLATLTSQLAALDWLTGGLLGIRVFAPVAAALAFVLCAPEERAWRWIFVGMPFAVLLAGFLPEREPVVDLTQVPAWLLAFARAGNTVFAAVIMLLLLDVFGREVLKSEAHLVVERQRSDRLLHAVLPRRIAEALRESDRAIADRHPEVTVLFADLAGFTPWAARRSPEEVVAVLDQVFSRFDALVARAGAEKIKTIGDAYMAICGAPDPCADHATVIARLALEFLEVVRGLREDSGLPLDLRVGMHSGPALAGVIGALRFTYDVWGDTVNTASRMESHGEPGRIHVSADTRLLLAEGFILEPRGEVDIKGKGRMETWWLQAEHIS
jgi:class 3 adenylate cyclase